MRSRMHSRDATLHEMLDSEAVDDNTLRRNLGDIRRINALLGWTAFTRAEVARVVRQDALRAFSLVDIAAGSADMVTAIARWAQRTRITAELLATDFNPRIVAIAREQVTGVHSVRVERQDALALPYPSGTFDIALCTLALHHFDPPEATEVLRNMRRIARHVMVFDVVRSRLAHAGAVLLTRAAHMDEMTRHDAAASVRRAYSRIELAALAQTAGLRDAHVWIGFPFRLALHATSDA